jgi:ATP synthase I chain
MDKIGNIEGTSLLGELRDAGVSGRIFRSMAVVSAAAVVVSPFFWHWRVTIGLLLGGMLALFNHHWLSGSAVAALNVAANGAKPKVGISRYILRYALVAAIVFLAYQLNLVSLGATIVGLCSFVAALFFEAIREFYFAIIRREEIS